MTEPAIEFENVDKVYRRRLAGREVTALDRVSFRVEAGEVCAFLGPNGAGKTTSISILMGFLSADSGAIRVLGQEPGDVTAKQQIGFVPENFAFYKHLSGEKLLKFHAALAGVPEHESNGLIRDLLSAVKLNGFEKVKIGKYSRGMVQRIGIAQALLADPRLLVMDEPTSGLDPAGRKEVRDLISSLKGAGKTVFLSSHLLSEVEQVCDRVIIINRGKLVRAGKMSELLAGGDQVEIVADRITDDIEAALREWGAVIEHSAQGVLVKAASARKRELAEMLWAAGCDVISMQPVKGSLEDIYMQLVGDGTPS
jgi:ABC-2 type transport system ATP-binding protein